MRRRTVKLRRQVLIVDKTPLICRTIKVSQIKLDGQCIYDVSATSGVPISLPAPRGISTLSSEVSMPCMLKSRKCLLKSCVEGAGERGKKSFELEVSVSPPR